MPLSAPIHRLLSAPIHRLKHKAKRISREDGIPLHAALDRIATEEGYSRWSHLAASSVQVDASLVFQKLSPGDLLLVAARPRQGKTRLGLELAARAMEEGRSAAMFSLEYTARDMVDRLRELGREPQRLNERFRFDDSDRICANYIVGELAGASRGALVVIDYLQLLDQRRENPPLADQVRRLRTFASRQEVIFVFISQIDRSYDPAEKPFPDFEDVRLPNPLDLSLFDKGCFLQGGETSFRSFRDASA